MKREPPPGTATAPGAWLDAVSRILMSASIPVYAAITSNAAVIDSRRAQRTGEQRSVSACLKCGAVQVYCCASADEIIAEDRPPNCKVPLLRLTVPMPPVWFCTLTPVVFKCVITALPPARSDIEHGCSAGIIRNEEPIGERGGIVAIARCRRPTDAECHADAWHVLVSGSQHTRPTKWIQEQKRQCERASHEHIRVAQRSGNSRKERR